ncbi:hypothetical protein AKJ16_DCAP21106, partial [Drosera capensis]
DTICSSRFNLWFSAVSVSISLGLKFFCNQYIPASVERHQPVQILSPIFSSNLIESTQTPKPQFSDTSPISSRNSRRHQNTLYN